MREPSPIEPVPQTGRVSLGRRVVRVLAWGLALLLISLVLLVLFAWVRQPRDPRFAGRELSAWMEDLVSLDPVARAGATNAIRQLGSNAVPALIVHLATPDPAFGRTATDAQKYLPRGLWVWAMKLTQPRAGLDRRWQSATALGLLGADATPPALPALTHAVHDADPRVSAAAIEALRGIRPAGLQAIVGAMDTTNQTLFAHLCSAIGRSGPDAAMVATQLVEVVAEAPPSWHSHLQAALIVAGPAAVGPLSALLRSNQAGIRDAAVAALQAMIRDHYGSLKAVVALLGTEDVRVRRAAVTVLSGRTFWERRTVAALVQTLSDQEKAVRLEAIGALSAISEWGDQVTNALPALRAFATATSGEEHDAAVAAVARIEATQRLP